MPFYKRKVTTVIVLALACTLCMLSCSKEKEFQPKYLVGYSVLKTYSKAEIVALIGSSDFFPSGGSTFVQFGVTVYRITYNTVDVNNKPIVASGALLVPSTNLQLPMLSFQHGTLSNPNEAPSFNQSQYNLELTFFASTGYNVAMPDYLGYGSTSNINHPYEHRASLATATRDMIRAAYEYFKANDLPEPENRFFLTGYSEGGFATMATVKLMQEEHPDEFNITAVTVGAGAYNKTATAKWVASANEDLEHINTFIWVLDVYNKIYPQLQKPYSAIFNEPWATLIAQNGVQTQIELNPAKLFKPDFISGLVNGTNTALLAALADNDCYDWKPGFPLQLYHGTADRLVPYLNTETAFQAMRNRGAQNVELITIDGGTHDTALDTYIFGTFVFFLSVQGKDATAAEKVFLKR